MNGFQNELDMMRLAERSVIAALAGVSPGKAASNILQTYKNLSCDAERAAFVAVLGTRVAVQAVTVSATT
jgi:hypothetical protein